jgi:hypothetical protein
VTELAFEVTVSAVAEIRDKDGNLISAEPVTSTMRVDEATARALMQGDPQ